MKFFFSILIFLTVSLQVHAQDAFYVSGLLGMTQVNWQSTTYDIDPELSAGLRGGLLFNDNVSAGLFLHRFNGDLENNGNAVGEITFGLIMAEVTYYFEPADENTFWISGLLGTARLKTEVGALSAEASETAMGVSVGYHWAVSPNFTLGPQMTYVYVDTSSSSGNLLSAHFNVTFWL